MHLIRIFLGFLFVLLCLVGLFIIFGGHGNKKPANPAGIVVQPLPDYANTTAQVSETTDGIVNGDELHRSIRVTVAASFRQLDVVQGYSGTVIQSNTFYNTPDAYSVFLHAINNYGFLAKQKKPKVSNDSSGYCALGNRFTFLLNQDGEDLSKTWSSTCGTSVGTSAGNSSTLLTLFQNQIPNYDTLTQTVNLSATSTQ